MIIGIDIAKDKLDCHNFTTKKDIQIKNTPQDIMCFLKEVAEDIELLTFESTGGYEKNLHMQLLRHHIPHHCAHPFRVHSFAKYRGYYAKTDKIDARILAEYGTQPHIQADQPVNEDSIKIRELVARRRQVKEHKQAERNRLSTPYICKDIARSIQREIKRMEKEVALLSDKINNIINSDKTLKDRYNLLQTVKGIGREVATTLIADLPELGHLSREAISNLIGVAPQNRDSGKKQKYRAISYGRPSVRKALYMAALVACRFNPRMKKIYQRLIAKGKKPKVALVAVMRKMIIMLNSMVKNNSPWQSERI